MVIQEYISLDNSSKWKAVLKNIQHSFFHTWENCYAMHLSNGLKTYLYYFEADKVKIICPISERVFGEHIDIVTPYGFSGFVGNNDCHSFANHWNNFIQQKGYICSFIGLNPIFYNSTYFDINAPSQYNNIYVLNLTFTSEQILKSFSTNRKRQIAKLQNANVKILFKKNDLIAFFLENYHQFITQKNGANIYNFSLKTLSFLFDLDNVFIVGAGKPDKVEAVSVFAYTSYVGDFLFNVSLPEGKHHSVALLWYAINYLKSLKIPFLNLGGGIRENDSLAQFKERFGGTKLPLTCLKQVYKPEIYQKLCQQVNVDPNDRTGYFPSYRKATLNY